MIRASATSLKETTWIGAQAQQWQQREVEPGAGSAQRVPIMYISADGTGVPMRKEELEGRQGKGPEGLAKTRQAYLGCVQIVDFYHALEYGGKVLVAV